MADDNRGKHHLRRQHHNRPRWRVTVVAVTVAVAVAAVLSGCTPPNSAAPSPPPNAKLVQTPGSPEPSIVLTPLGAERIGLQTAPVTAGHGGKATFPYSALLYEPDGQAAAYVATGVLTFTRHFVVVGTIKGNTVTAASGVKPGDRVATDGAEELLGVQNHVGEET